MKNLLFKKYVLIILTSMVLTTIARAASNSPSLLFYAPFVRDASPVISNGSSKPLYNENVKMSAGKFGGAASVVSGETQLVYDGPGNVYSQAGTISFFWKPDVDPAGQNVTILNLSPLEQTDKGRYMLLSYIAGKFTMYLSAGNLGGQQLTSDPILIVPGQWHHLALCWDQTSGLEFYVDGTLAFHFDKRWIYEGAIGAIGFGVPNIMPGSPPVSTFSASYDEFRVYDQWLEDSALEQLQRGSAPKPAPLDASSLVNRRRLVYQWGSGNEDKVPQLKLGVGGGLGLRQVGIESAQSSQGNDWIPFDGQQAASWPGDNTADSDGQSLQITMQNNQPFDVVQMFGLGKMSLTEDDNKKTLADFNSDKIVYNYYLPQPPVAALNLSLQKLSYTDGNGKDQHSSSAYEMDFFKEIRYPYSFDNSWQALSLRPANGDDQTQDGLLNIRQAFYTIDQQTLMTQDGTTSGQITAPAINTIHIVGPSHPEKQGLGAIALELNIGSGGPEFLRVQVTDPLTPMHSLTSAVIHLEGGSGILRLLLDNRNTVLPAGASPAISLTFSNDTVIDLAGSTIRYQWQSVEEATPEHEHDQTARGKSDF